MPVTSTSAYGQVAGVVPLIQSLLNDQQGNTFTIPGLPLGIVGSPLGATQSGTTVTIETTYPHGLLAGQQVYVTGVAGAGYNGLYTVVAIPAPNQFTYTAGAGLAPSGGGTATFQQGTIQQGQINLMPLINSAYRTVRRKLGVTGSTNTITDNVILTVPAITAVDATVQVVLNDATPPPNQLPYNLIEPLKLWERVHGSTDQFVEMVDMTLHGGLPSRQQDTTRLSIWEWRTDGIWFIGALSPVDVRIRYRAGLPDLIGGGDTMLTRDILDAIAYFTAAIVAGARDSPLGAKYDTMGMDALEDLIKEQTHRSQYSGKRRRSYSHRKGLNR